MILNPLTLFLTSGALYTAYEWFRSVKNERKKKVDDSLYHIFDIALEDEDDRAISDPARAMKLKIVKRGQYFPAFYSTAVSSLPITLPIAFGVLAADYFTDRMRRIAAKKRLKEMQEEFDELVNTAMDLAKEKYALKSASRTKTAAITKTAFLPTLTSALDSLMNVVLGTTGTGMTHKDIVHTYTYSITPYALWSTYEAAKAQSSAARSAEAASQFLSSARLFNVPAAASIPALQRAIIYKYRRPRSAEAESQTAIQDYEKFFPKKAPEDPNLEAGHRDRLTIQDIYNLAEEQKRTEEQKTTEEKLKPAE